MGWGHAIFWERDAHAASFADFCSRLQHGAAAGALVAGSGCALCHAVRNVGVAVSGHGWHGGLWRVYLRQRVNVEMVFVAALLVGIGMLNAVKFYKILQTGLGALQADQSFQLTFYVYMTFLGTVLPPFIVWLVLRELSDELRNLAARDPMTQLLNRRGLSEALQ